MKKSVLILGIAGLFTIIGCKKEGNKDVIKQESIDTRVTNENGVVDSTTSISETQTVDGKKSGSNSYTYKGIDGTRATVIFSNSEKEHTVTVKTGTAQYQLDQTSENNYERAGIKAEKKGDSLIITQGENTIPLVWDR